MGYDADDLVLRAMPYAGYIATHATELVGFLLPPLIDVLNKDVHDDRERFIVTGLVCVLVALIIHFPELTAGSVDGIFASFALIFAESQVVFKVYFQTSFLRQKLQTKLDPPPSPPEVSNPVPVP